MHESSLAKRLVEAVLEHARRADARHVRTVRGFIAETESLSPESLEFHFAAHARGTAAEGAALELRLIHVAACCRDCHTTYAPEHHVLLCPACGSAEGEELGGTGLGIEALEVD